MNNQRKDIKMQTKYPEISDNLDNKSVRLRNEGWTPLDMFDKSLINARIHTTC